MSTIIAGLVTMSGCVSPTSRETTYRDGSRAGRTIEFSGYTWRIKSSDGFVGPGPNRFSDGPESVWVDEQGRLHLTIQRREGVWHCTEIVCETPVGYGTYAFYLDGPVDELDPNVVLGLFTWDDDSFQSQANTEIDIEFSRWTEANAPNLHYSVQPARGPDEPGGRYHERFTAMNAVLEDPLSTHVFDWTPEGITFAGFEGHKHPTANLMHSWEYKDSHPARRAGEGHRVSDPVAVPAPGPDTSIRLNLWLVNANGDGRGDDPSDGKDVEVIVSRFEYRPRD